MRQLILYISFQIQDIFELNVKKSTVDKIMIV